jgi:radical SAM protein with 4Fe4S-binding SPASM domain
MNFCLVSFQSFIAKNSCVVGYPLELVMDPSNICNLHCPLCPTGQGRSDRSKGKMSFNNFKRTIDELGRYLYRIDLHNWGEPLLNPDLFKMIAYAHVHGIEVRVSSNLNAIDQTKAEKLVKSGLDVLIVSLDGVSQETYSKYRVGGSFEKVTNGIKTIITIRNELGVSKPLIVWQFLVMKHNEHEISKAKVYSEQLAVNKLDLWAIRCDMGREIFWDDKTKIERTADWLPKNENFLMYDLATHKRKIKPRTCNFLWVQAAINWNGSVSPCCALYEEKYDFGNAFSDGFMQVWNNNKYRQARKVVRTKKLVQDRQLIACCFCVKNGFI